MPDSRLPFWSEIWLGLSLLGQKKFAEAEPRLLSGYRGLKARVDTFSPPQKTQTNEVLDRIIKLYEGFGRKDQRADEWPEASNALMDIEAQGQEP